MGGDAEDDRGVPKRGDKSVAIPRFAQWLLVRMSLMAKALKMPAKR
jgi:hypothetical protein